MGTKASKLHTVRAGKATVKFVAAGHQKVHKHEKGDRLTAVLAAVVAALSAVVFVNGWPEDRIGLVLLVGAVGLAVAAAATALAFRLPKFGLPLVAGAAIVGIAAPTAAGWLPVAVGSAVVVVGAELVLRRLGRRQQHG